MWQKSILFALAVAALCLSIPQAQAGGDTVEPNPGPAPHYDYAPPQPVYYPPPALRVVVYPAFGFYPRPYGFYRYYHGFGPHRYWHRHHWH